MNQTITLYNLLFVDDDIEVLSINEKYFKQQGFTVRTASNAREALETLHSFDPDCMILDLMMPEQDGFQAFESIRKLSQAPVIFLTGRDSEDDKIHGLLLGADDYVIKPYSFRELEARIQVVIRRYNASRHEDNKILDFSPLTINRISHQIFYKNQEIDLSKKEYQFLLLLAESAGKEFSFEEIGTQLWGTYLESDRKTIMVTASRLRKKLSVYPGLENCITTVWSKGYKFVR